MAQPLDPKGARQLRGMILRLVYVNHNAQGTRLNSTLIWGVLDREGWRFSLDDVLTMTQDLSDRGYLRFQKMRDPVKNRWHLFAIELTAEGRDLFDGLKEDPAVQTD